MKTISPNQKEAAAFPVEKGRLAESLVSPRKETLIAAAAALFLAGQAFAQTAEIPAVPASVMANAREQAGPHPDAKPAPASVMGLRPERRAAAAADPKAALAPTTHKAGDQVDLQDAVDQAVKDVKESKKEARSKRAADSSRKEEAASDKAQDAAQTAPAITAADQAAAKSVIVRSSRVNVLPGVNVVIPIARNQPNRLLTPFKHPQVLSTDLEGGQGDNCGEACVRGSVLYVSTDQAKPVTAFITEKGREDIAISVTMIPERIAPRQVEFLLPKSVLEKLNISDMGSVEGSGTQARAWEQSQPYIDTLKESFKTIALGQVPQGFSLRNARYSDKLPVCKQHGLKFDFRRGQVLEGHNLLIYVGILKNEAAAPVEFNETRCGAWNVAAVTSFPKKVLDSGEQTEVYVAVKRDVKPAAGTVRRPLIDRKY